MLTSVAGTEVAGVGAGVATGAGVDGAGAESSRALPGLSACFFSVAKTSKISCENSWSSVSSEVVGSLT